MWWQSPCELCMNQSCCENQSKANAVSICKRFKPNILATVPHSLRHSYSHHAFVSAMDITTGFLKIAIFNLLKTPTGDIVQSTNPIKILTVETNPFIDKFGFEEEIRYKLKEL